MTCLSGGEWTFDGAPVTVPHTWNVTDAADGVNTMLHNPGNSVGSPSYCRGAHTYRRALPVPKAGKRYFVRFEGVSSRAELRVNDKYVGEHYGAFTAFAFEITDFLKPSGNELAIIADNSLDRNVPPITGDFSLFGGVYRDVWLIERLTDEGYVNPCPRVGSVVMPKKTKLRKGHILFVKEPLDVLPDRIVFNDDVLAQGALTALLARGVRIPEDVKVVSLFNRGAGPVFVKPLTRFETDAKEDGRIVAEYVVGVLSDRNEPTPPVLGSRYVVGATFP